jgi:hypothetical protein
MIRQRELTWQRNGPLAEFFILLLLLLQKLLRLFQLFFRFLRFLVKLFVPQPKFLGFFSELCGTGSLIVPTSAQCSRGFVPRGLEFIDRSEE